MKVIVAGAHGQLGYELQQTVPTGVECLALGRDGLDITDKAAIKAVLAAEKPDLLVNASAYTAVDKAESEKDAAYAVNEQGVANLAQACKAAGVRLIHISTDFVFDGSQSRPYLPEDPVCPVSVYGASKLAGEQQLQAIDPSATIIRTSWVYSAHGNNFVKTMLRLMAERDVLGVVADQVGTPTWAYALAEAVWAVAQKPAISGVYHWSDAGAASWYDFAVAIEEEGRALGLLESSTTVNPINTADYPTPAARPHYSVLDKNKSWQDFELAGTHWRVNLRSMLEQLKQSV